MKSMKKVEVFTGEYGLHGFEARLNEISDSRPEIHVVAGQEWLVYVLIYVEMKGWGNGEEI